MDNRNLCVWENLPEYARRNNLSVRLDKLTAAGYIKKKTDGSGAKARTICMMTDTGRTAMQNYVNALKTYFSGLDD